jgi:hypothetical protein
MHGINLNYDDSGRLCDNSVMHHLRYNIVGALGAILFFAVGFAAL